MVALYVTSIEQNAGKDVVALGILDRLRRDGFRAGYFKPVGYSPIKLDEGVADKEARRVREHFQIEERVEDLCPVVITQEMVVQHYDEGVSGLLGRVEEAFKTVSAGKDILVVTGESNFSRGGAFGLSGLQILRQLDAVALFVETCESVYCVDYLLELKRLVGDAMLGIVFNKADSTLTRQIDTSLRQFLKRHQLEVFGVVPRDAILGSIVVNDLVEKLGTDVVCGRDQLNNLIERFLVGGMQVDRFINYLLNSPGAAVIVGGDRTDIQLVAIENNVRALVLSGNLYPNQTIVSRAEARRVPVVVAREDTYTVAKRIERLGGRFCQASKEKFEHGLKVVDESLDFPALYDRLDLRRA